MTALPEPRTREEMRDRYRAACRRQMEAARRYEEGRAQAAAPPAPVIPTAAEATPEDRTALDALVFEILDPGAVDRTPRRIIARIALDHGVCAADIIGRCYDRQVIKARHAAVVAVHLARPDLSLPSLGRIFQRDHTTILHQLRRADLRAQCTERAA